jgi:hypothetical protein
MMSVVPFRWQGSTRATQVRDLVLARSQEWLKQWSAGPASLNVVLLSDPSGPESMASDRWYRVEAMDGTMHLRTAGNAAEQLGCRLAGVVSPDAQALARGVGNRALADLAKFVSGSDGAAAAMDEKPANAILQARSGVVALRWSMDGVAVDLYVDAKWCDAMVPRQRASGEKLVARSQAILPAQITLHAELDLGDAALEDTLTLRPGEIIKTNVPLDRSISVRSQTGETLFTGALVAADGHRAVRCTHNPRG